MEREREKNGREKKRLARVHRKDVSIKTVSNDRMEFISAIEKRKRDWIRNGGRFMSENKKNIMCLFK